MVQAQLHKAQVLRLSSSPRKTFEEDTSSSDSSCGAAWQVQKPLRPFANINQWIKPAQPSLSLLGCGFLSWMPPRRVEKERSVPLSPK